MSKIVDTIIESVIARIMNESLSTNEALEFVEGVVSSTPIKMLLTRYIESAAEIYDSLESELPKDPEGFVEYESVDFLKEIFNEDPRLSSLRRAIFAIVARLSPDDPEPVGYFDDAIDNVPTAIVMSYYYGNIESPTDTKGLVYDRLYFFVHEISNSADIQGSEAFDLLDRYYGVNQD